MSDNRRRYCAIRTALKGFYPCEPKGNVARHLSTLAGLVSGIVASRCAHLPKIAQKVPDQTKKESRLTVHPGTNIPLLSGVELLQGGGDALERCIAPMVAIPTSQIWRPAQGKKSSHGFCTALDTL